MQSKPMAAWAGCEPVAKDSSHILGGDSHAVVDHRDRDPECTRCDLNRNALVAFSRVLAAIFGVANEIHQNLQYPVFIYRDGGHVLKIARERDSMAGKRFRIQLHTVGYQIRDGHALRHTAVRRVTLLHPHNVLDVLDTLYQ